ncbi:MAG: 16S rRNA (adenine(1518)-N(6)/adenine(1519)-N(6))-dimethyltransferase RsmA [Ignavibacteria bacterium]
MNRIQPLKRFGQNYLQDRNILLKIVDEINPQEDDALIEIGPGHGMLTGELSARTGSLTAVEIDNRVIDELRARFPGVNIINNDFLKLDILSLFELKGKKLRVAGNIPYNITSPIIFRLIERTELVEDAVFMMQYEVARRLSSDRGTKDYGILAVILKYFGEVKFCFKVPPEVFYPKPKVFSAVVHIYFNQSRTDNEFNKAFIKVVKAAFGNRRKTLKNSLSNSIFGQLNFEPSGVDMKLRAEQLEQNDFIRLTEFVLNNERL